VDGAGSPGRPRQVVTILVFGLGGPPLAYVLLRPAGGSLPSVVFALACLGSARLRRPLIFRLAVEILGPDTPYTLVRCPAP
jgi:hypothetical protein